MNNNNQISFEIDPFRKKCLIDGLDEIALTLKKSNFIDEYENKVKKITSWII